MRTLQRVVQEAVEKQKEVTTLSLELIQAQSNRGHLEGLLHSCNAFLENTVDELNTREETLARARAETCRLLGACEEALLQVSHDTFEAFRRIKEVRIVISGALALRFLSSHNGLQASSQDGPGLRSDGAVAQKRLDLRIVDYVPDGRSLQRSPGVEQRSELEVPMEDLAESRTRMKDLEETIVSGRVGDLLLLCVRNGAVDTDSAPLRSGGSALCMNSSNLPTV